MNITKLLIGTIAGGLVFFLLGWLVYGNLLADYMSHHAGRIGHLADRKEMDFLYIAVGNLVQGLLFSYIFLKGNVNTLAAGLVTGAILGFLMGVGVDCLTYGTTLMLSKRGMLGDVIAFTVISAIAGAVIGAVTGGKGSKTS